MLYVSSVYYGKDHSSSCAHLVFKETQAYQFALTEVNCLLPCPLVSTAFCIHIKCQHFTMNCFASEVLSLTSNTVQNKLYLPKNTQGKRQIVVISVQCFICSSIRQLNRTLQYLGGVSGTKYSRNTLTYLYKHLIDVNGILGTGFYKDGMDGVGIVLGILLCYLPVITEGRSKLLCCYMHTVSNFTHDLLIKLFFHSYYVEDFPISQMTLILKVDQSLGFLKTLQRLLSEQQHF